MKNNRGHNGSAVEVVNLSKAFRCCNRKALDDVSLSIEPGQMVALIGASGSGKSTLLRHIAGLTVGNRHCGGVKVLGQTVQENGSLSGNIHKMRSRIGFIFQHFNLVDRLPVITNVLAGRLGRVPLWRGSMRLFTKGEKEMAMEALSRVGMSEFASQRADRLSGGQKQRTAIAKVLVQQAEVILADEPIASLDPESSRQVMDILSQINREQGITMLISLHQVEFAMKYCPFTVALNKGLVVYAGETAGLSPLLLQLIYSGRSVNQVQTETCVGAKEKAARGAAGKQKTELMQPWAA